MFRGKLSQFHYFTTYTIHKGDKSLTIIYKGDKSLTIIYTSDHTITNISVYIIKNEKKLSLYNKYK